MSNLLNQPSSNYKLAFYFLSQSTHPSHWNSPVIPTVIGHMYTQILIAWQKQQERKKLTLMAFVLFMNLVSSPIASPMQFP